MAAKGQTQDQEPAVLAMREVWQAAILEYDMVNQGVTQSRKATALGVTDPVYISWMKGESLPSLPNFVRLAELWGVPLEELVYDAEHPQPLFNPRPPDVRGPTTGPSLPVTGSLHRKRRREVPCPPNQGRRRRTPAARGGGGEHRE